MKDEKKTVGRDAPEPKRSGRLCKTSESGSGGQRTENLPGFSRGECQDVTCVSADEYDWPEVRDEA